MTKEIQDKEEIILKAISGLEYGSVTIHIQDGKIVYVERTEKTKVK